MRITAQDKGTGKSQDMTITASSNLSEEEIDKAVKDAEQFAEEDKKRKEVVDARNELDHMIFSIEKFMKESGDKLSEEEKAKLNAEMEDAKGHMNSEDAEELRAALKKLQDGSADIFTKFYQQAQAEAQAQNPNPGNPNEFDGSAQ